MGSVKCCLQIILFYESGVLLMQHFSRVSPNAAITLSTGTPVVKEHAMTVHRKIFFLKKHQIVSIKGTEWAEKGSS